MTNNVVAKFDTKAQIVITVTKHKDFHYIYVILDWKLPQDS